MPFLQIFLNFRIFFKAFYFRVKFVLTVASLKIYSVIEKIEIYLSAVYVLFTLFEVHCFI